MAAYLDCRRTKRTTAAALAFELDQKARLESLAERLLDGTYAPGPSTCFVVTRPKPREVWAARFEDRIVHHLLHRRIAPRFERTFIAGTCACIEGRGTLHSALHRLAGMPAADVAEAATSYLGLARQATHGHRDRTRIANTARRRGLAVDHRLTKVYA